jgi:MiaB-like tRNA modifying enzyme
MHKVFFQTHGCSNNSAESEMMMGLLKEKGFQIDEKAANAEIAVINVCTVKGEFTAIRKVKQFLDANKGKRLIVAGCLTPKLIQQIREITEDASLINTHNIGKIVEVAEETLNGNVIEAVSYEKEKKYELARVRRNPVIGIIPILTGCNNDCAYCSVKLVKGRLESYPKESLVKEANCALQEGCKEIWITSQDNAAYGMENIWRSSLPELLKDILSIKKEFIVRIGMMNVKNLMPIADDMIKIFKNDNVFKFLHIPLQSGNDGILEKMKRNYTVNEFRELISTFRREIPDITIATDIIVGFPGEKEEQFSDSIDVIREIRPDVLNISRFIPREGTPAFGMKERVDSNEAKRRSKIMTDIFANMSAVLNERWLDWEGEILIDERGKEGSWIGRNYAYKQIVVKGNYELGLQIRVRVNKVTPYDLRGEEIK